MPLDAQTILDHLHRNVVYDIVIPCGILTFLVVKIKKTNCSGLLKQKI